MSSVSDPALFDDPTTPQARALEWITNEDAIVPTLCPNIEGSGCKLDGVNPMVQRYALATFYFATNGDDWTQCSAPANGDTLTAANDACNRIVTPFGVENDRVGDTSTDAWLGPVNECFWGGVACWGADTPNLNLCVDQLDFGECMYDRSTSFERNMNYMILSVTSLTRSLSFLTFQQRKMDSPEFSFPKYLSFLRCVSSSLNRALSLVPSHRR
jgi:hypothetical protein